MKYYLQDMRDAYIEAAYFTDGHGEEISDPEFTIDFEAEAYESCVRFENACNDLGINIRDLYPDPTQIGHDLWFTRNHHGVGFWDRKKIYGDHSDQFTAMAHAMGEHYSDFVEA